MLRGQKGAPCRAQQRPQALIAWTARRGRQAATLLLRLLFSCKQDDPIAASSPIERSAHSGRQDAAAIDASRGQALELRGVVLVPVHKYQGGASIADSCAVINTRRSSNCLLDDSLPSGSQLLRRGAP